MLLQFSVKNYRSFKEEVTFSLLASEEESATLGDGVAMAHCDAGNSFRALKSAAIYGANSSGKSNLIKAISFSRRLVLDSLQSFDIDQKIPVRPFLLNVETRDKPSHFSFIFSSKNSIYQYEFSVTSQQITSESLTIQKNSGDTVEAFSRIEDSIVINEAVFDEGINLPQKTRANVLFISVCANFNGKISTEVLRWFKNIKIMSGVNDFSLLENAKDALHEDGTLINNLLDHFDLGFTKIKAIEDENVSAFLNSPPKELAQLISAINSFSSTNKKTPRSIQTIHTVFDSKKEACDSVEFNLENDESEGTKKLVALAVPIQQALQEQITLVIDEFDARLHPLITKQIVRIFNSSITNPNNAQLIVATHDTSLLDKEVLRRDQVWFVDKNSFGESKITSLLEYKVGKNKDYERNYTIGKYGAIPILKNTTSIIGQKK